MESQLLDAHSEQALLPDLLLHRTASEEVLEVSTVADPPLQVPREVLSSGLQRRLRHCGDCLCPLVSRHSVGSYQLQQLGKCNEPAGAALPRALSTNQRKKGQQSPAS